MSKRSHLKDIPIAIRHPIAKHAINRLCSVFGVVTCDAIQKTGVAA